MSRIATECSLFGSSQGGMEDLTEVNRIAASPSGVGKRTQQDKKTILRWDLMQALSLIKTHGEARQPMLRFVPVDERGNIIDDNVDASALWEEGEA